MLLRWFSFFCALGTLYAAQQCSQIDPRLNLPCMCQNDASGAISVNCDYVAFKDNLPLLPFLINVVEYRQRHAGLQVLNNQLFTASQLPLKAIDFSRNSILNLNGRVFDGLEKTLESLNLDHNKLGDVYQQELSLPEVARLVALKSLNLGYNEIQRLSHELLQNLSNLQVLQLEGNYLAKVPTEAMRGLTELKVLTLQENVLDKLRWNEFSTVPMVVFLNVSSNNIKSVENGAFQGLKNMTALDLSYNRLRNLDSGVFEGLSELTELDLSSNFFNEVPADGLKHLVKLQSLNMQNNMIVTLGGIVALGPSETLKVLDLSRNSIVNLESRTFARLKSLKTLRLSINSVGKKNAATFEGLVSLETLDLDDHRFFSFPSQMLAKTPDLKSLSLNYNRIRVITAYGLNVVKGLESLSMANNIIQEIPPNTFRNFSQLQELNLFGNNIANLSEESLAHLEESLLELNLGSNALTSVPNLNLPRLTKLTLAGNKMTSLNKDVFFLLPQLQLLDLSHNKISALPIALFHSLSRLGTLDISENNLKIVESGQFNGTVISVINMRRNQIERVKSKAFESLFLLTSLDLSENQIEEIEEGALHDTGFLHILNLGKNKLTSFKNSHVALPSYATTQLRYLDLSQNDITFLPDDAFSYHPKVIWLSLRGNRLSFFPSKSFVALKSITNLDLSDNVIENLQDSDFSNSVTLKELNLNGNIISKISPTAFQNSSQLRELNLGSNNIKILDKDTFQGIIQLKLDLSNNQISAFPNPIFERSKLNLISLNIAHNKFREVPEGALDSQYIFLESLNMANNSIRNIPDKANILGNVKFLDLSFNPLTSNDVLELLNEPKLVRNLNLAGTEISDVPLIEARFLISLNLSNNMIKELSDKTFKLTHNLRVLDLSNNYLPNIHQGLSTSWPELPNLYSLDISNNPIKYIIDNDFSNLPHLEILKLSKLEELTKIESSALMDLSLKELSFYDIPNVNNINMQKLLDNLSGLEKVDIELTDRVIDDQLRGAFSPRLKEMTIRGPRVQRIKSSAFLNLNSPNLDLGIINTNVSTLDERMLFLIPMSSKVTLLVNQSRIETISPKFLEDVVIPREGNLKLVGLDSNPLYCDCHFTDLQKWIKENEDSDLKEATCSGPSLLSGRKVISLSPSQLVCSDRTKEERNNLANIITKDNEIIDRKIPKYREPEREDQTSGSTTKFTSMDKIIIGVVGGVIGFVALLIILVCLIRLLCDPKRKVGDHMNHEYGNCTCVKPPMANMGYVGPYSISGSRAGTLKSMPPTTPIPPPYGTLGAHSRGSVYSGPPSYMGMYPHQDEPDYR